MNRGEALFLSLVRGRRSIRKYQPRAVEKEKVDRLIEILLRSPSSRGLNPRRYIIVQEGNLLERLAGARTHGSEFLAGAPLAIAICGVPEESDGWIEDASIAGAMALIGAEALGLGGCWIQIREKTSGAMRSSEEYVREILGISVRVRVEALISLGYPDEEPAPHPRQDLESEKVFHNLYGQIYGM